MALSELLEISCSMAAVAASVLPVVYSAKARTARSSGSLAEESSAETSAAEPVAMRARSW